VGSGARPAAPPAIGAITLMPPPCPEASNNVRLALGRAHRKRSASTCPTIRPRRSRAAQRQAPNLDRLPLGSSHQVPTLAHRQRRAARRHVAVPLDHRVLPPAATLAPHLHPATS